MTSMQDQEGTPQGRRANGPCLRRWGRRERLGSIAIALVGLAAIASALAPAGRAAAVPPMVSSESCAPLDLALVLDTSTSMDPAIDGVKDGIRSVLDTVDSASGGDYRVGLVDFGGRIGVHVPFADRNLEEVRKAIDPLRQDVDNIGFPEPWDVALHSVISGTAGSKIRIQDGTFPGPWRDDAEKLIILVSDARPSGLNDGFEEKDGDNAIAAAVAAAEAEIRIASIFVPNGNDEGGEGADEMLKQTAETSGGTYFATNPDGSNLAEGIDLVVRTCAKDSDGDALYDVWEEEGIPDENGELAVDLPAMGANPKRMDLFVHVGWMDPSVSRRCFLFWCLGNGDGPHPPTQIALQRVVDAFASAPIRNPDGSTGIDVRFDAGSYTPDGGIPEELRVPVLLEHRDHAAENRSSAAANAAFERLARAYPPERRAVFTLVSYVHEIAPEGPAGKASGLPGDSVMIADEQLPSDDLEAVALFHELGHTLGLRHGGADHVNGKPNYPSLMNYDHALAGGVQIGEKRVLDYSRWDFDELDETRSLDEARGVTQRERDDRGVLERRIEKTPLPADLHGSYHCDPDSAETTPFRIGRPVDWNCDGDENDKVEGRAVHRYEPDIGDEQPRLLVSRNDWAGLTFAGGVRGGLESAGQPIPDGDVGLTEEAWRATPKEYAVALSGPGAVEGDGSAGAIALPFFIENIGTADDTYAVSARSDSGGAEPEIAHPDTVSLEAGESSATVVELAVPDDASRGEAVTIELTLRSQGSEAVTATDLARVTIGPPAEPAAHGELTASPNPAGPGSRLSVTGSGFEPGSPISLRVEGSGWRQPLSRIADDDGTTRFRLVAPAEEQLAQLNMLGIAEGSSLERAQAEPLRLQAELRVSGEQSLLDRWPLALAAALGLIAVAAVALLVRRRVR